MTSNSNIIRHPDADVLEKLFPAVQAYQELAVKHGIQDIFQDSGGKTLQILLLTGFKASGRKHGEDAFSPEGKSLEFKTVNIDLTNGYSTNRDVNSTYIARYRKVDWCFAEYKGIELQQIFYLESIKLERYFKLWEDKLIKNGKRGLNNPKIHVKYVREVGQIIYQK